MTIIVAVVVGGASFFGGMKYQQTKQPSLNRQFGQQIGGQQRGGNRTAGIRPTSGEIIASDDKSITVKLADGSSKIILLSDKTTINQTMAGTKADLKMGVKVAMFGTENPDGSVTASSIQVNPTVNMLGRQTPNQKPKSTDAREIVIEGSNYKFSPNSITVKKGEKIRIVFKNTDGMHDFKVDELNIATAMVESGQEDFVEFTPDKTGSFEFYCSIGNHRAMGMKGTLIVQ